MLPAWVKYAGLEAQLADLLGLRARGRRDIRCSLEISLRDH